MARKKKEIVTTHSPKEKLFGLHYCIDHGGKMTGVESLSTSNFLNPFCKDRMGDKELVCHKCYSTKFQKLYPALHEVLLDNYRVMRSIKNINDSEIPYTVSSLFRFQAFGDIRHTDELEFYIKLARKNPQTQFALWTKNIFICEQYFYPPNRLQKPDNFMIVYSVPEINDNSYDKDYPWFVDHVFTVYTKDYVKEHNEEINCGDDMCIKCRKCYYPTTESERCEGAFFINEILK